MPVSALQSGYQMLQNSTQMVDDSSRELNRAKYQHRQDNTAQPTPATDPATKPVDQANKSDTAEQKKFAHKSPDDVHALINLNQAKQYGRIGANVIQRDQDVIGSLLDVHI